MPKTHFGAHFYRRTATLGLSQSNGVIRPEEGQTPCLHLSHKKVLRLSNNRRERATSTGKSSPLQAILLNFLFEIGSGMPLPLC